MDVNPTFDIGNPKLKDIWVDPVNGDDKAGGTARQEAVRSLTRAWALIPDSPAEDGHGWQIMLCPGKYEPQANGQIVLTDRHATVECPIIIRSADEPLSAELPAVNAAQCRALYLIDVKVVSPGVTGINISQNNVLHFASCRDILLRRVVGIGLGEGEALPALVVKVNQCLRVYIEDCELSGAKENTIDYVAVHYGHIVRNRLHDTGCECLYVKGGSGYHLIAGNEVFNSRNHGILAGQSTGFQYLVSPWLHYEAYDIKIVNNIVHDAGSGLAVFGGYNILMAYNTCYRVGTSRDTILAGFGGRGWITERFPIVDEYLAAGGWCHPEGEMAFNIPNRNVQICNNIVYNPDGFESKFAHFGIPGPVPTAPGSNIPSPAHADEGLEVRGNVIWNGPADKPLLDDCEGVYHLAAKPTIDPALLIEANEINTVCPDLVNPEQGDYHVLPGGSMGRIKSVMIPDFDWTDAPTVPPVPEGNFDNQVPIDREGHPRTKNSYIGAYTGEEYSSEKQ